MPWEKKDKYYAQESETKYIICAIRINDVLNYECWAPNKDLKGYTQLKMFSSSDQAKQFCESHFQSKNN